MQTLTIVGGGVAGAALAAWLDPRRWEVTLIEQRPELPAVGTAFGIWPFALRVLDAHGLGEVVRSGQVHVTDGVIADAEGRPIVRARLITPQAARVASANVRRISGGGPRVYAALRVLTRAG